MGTESIQVVYEAIGTPGLESYHGTLLYTNSAGEQFYAGGTRSNQNMTADQVDDPSNILLAEAAQATGGSIASPYGSLITITGSVGDSQQQTLGSGWFAANNPSQTLATGSNLSSQWNTIVSAMEQINSANVPYAPLTQNSNSAWCTAATAADLSPPLGDAGLSSYWVPGCPNILPTTYTQPSTDQQIQLNSISNPTQVNITQSDGIGIASDSVTINNGSGNDNIAMATSTSAGYLESVYGSGNIGVSNGANVDIASGSDITLSGSALTVNMLQDASAVVTGTGSGTNTINATTDDTVSNSGSAAIINGSGSNLTVSDSTVHDAINLLGNGSSATVNGDHLDFTVSGTNSNLTSTGNYSNITTTGSGDTTVEDGNREAVYMEGNNDTTVSNGAFNLNDAVANNDLVNVYGHDNITWETGQNDFTNNYGDYDDWTAANTVTSSGANYGVGDSVGQAEFGFNDDGYGYGTNGTGGWTDGGYGYGYGLAGNQAAVSSTLGGNATSLMQFNLSSNASVTSAGLDRALAELNNAIATDDEALIKEGAAWDQKTVTWSLAGPQGDGSQATPQEISDAQHAFAEWSVATGIHFVQVSDTSAANIEIGWADLDTADTGRIGLTKYRSAGGIMQSAQIELEAPTETALESGISGDLTYESTQASLTQVMTHEIGHALGFADNASTNSIMSYYLGSSNQGLSTADTEAATALYDTQPQPGDSDHMTPASTYGRTEMFGLSDGALVVSQERAEITHRPL